MSNNKLQTICPNLPLLIDDICVENITLVSLFKYLHFTKFKNSSQTFPSYSPHGSRWR